MFMRLLIFTCCLMPTFVWGQKTWNLDLAKAEVRFNKFDDEVEGKIKGLKASVKMDLDDPSKGSIMASVDAATLNTGISDRDQHLRTDEFFHVSRFPLMEFKSSSIIKTPSGYLAKGSLTITNVTKEVYMPFIYQEEENRFVGRMRIHSAHFGVMGDEAKDDDYNIVVRITLPAK